MTIFMLFASVPRPAGRLSVGIALSLLAHLLLVVSLRPTTTAYTPPRPFQVEILQAASKPDLPFAVTAESGPAATATAMATPAESRPVEAPLPNTSAAPAAGIDLQFIAENYLTSREVDVRAEPINEVDLVYPQLAYQQRLRGKVTLRLLISARGELDQVSVLESEPRGVFEEAALTATRALRFSPAKKHGRNVKSRKDIAVVFDPYESIHVP